MSVTGHEPGELQRSDQNGEDAVRHGPVHAAGAAHAAGLDLCQVQNVIEACLLVAGKPMNLGQLQALFEADAVCPDKPQLRAAIEQLQSDYEGRGIELVEVASGYRLQSRESMASWVGRMFQEKPARYSRALLETLVLVAYRQPITRGEIEEVRGVAVSANIIQTLREREWIKAIGHKEVPGRPELFATTRQFLDYFTLKRLDDLPSLNEIRDLDKIEAELLAGEMDLRPGDAATADAMREAAAAAAQAEADAEAAAAAEGNASEGSATDQPAQAGAEEPDVEPSGAEYAGAAHGGADVGAESGSDSQVQPDGPAPEPAEDDPGTDLEPAEHRLHRVIAEFAADHQDQLAAQLELTSHPLPNSGLPDVLPDQRDENSGATESPADAAAEPADSEPAQIAQHEEPHAPASDHQRAEHAGNEVVDEIGGERYTGDMPQPGDTLH